ncbi:MAG: hypothetical protein LBB72_03410 [Spirochaetaceae bacterium]|nr:hypothetical protein [Spirochaetaceae bacterium]
MFDRFNAVPTISTEARYSAGVFTSDVDNYIGINKHDPKIGTFFFLGGYPSIGSVDFTRPITYALSFGLGKTFKAFYLGVYYGGSLLEAEGSRYKDEDGEGKESAWAWENHLAVLVRLTGINIGAFRFDLVADTDTELTTYKGNIMEKDRISSPSIALTWGGLKFAGIAPYATLGYKFPDLVIAGGGDPYKQQKISSNGAFGVQLGGKYDLDSNSSVSADTVFTYSFATNHSGDMDPLKPYKEGGGWNAGLKLGYSQILPLGKVSAGLKPSLLLGYVSESHKTTYPDAPQLPSNNYFELAGKVDLGVKYQHSALLTFYTGASLSIFDWVTLSHSGGDSDNKDDTKLWLFRGLTWDASKFNTSNHLGFGLTITPSEGFIIGLGLNGLLDKLFYIDLNGMQVGTGTDFNDSEANNVGDWATHFLRGLKFDITLSYKM